jgi:uncharacterized protein YciU (UPF0263 family)
MAELDIFEDTTADNPFEDTTAAQEQQEDLLYGDAIDWESTYDDASKYLGVSEEQWKAFVEEVNAIKAEMNAYEGNVAAVMQERSTPNMVRDRRVAVLLNQNPDMTEEEAIAQVESSPQYQEMVAGFEQYEALNSRLNDLYESVGLDSQGTITGSDKSISGGEVRFDLNTGGTTFVEIGSKFRDLAKGVVMGIAAGVATAGIGTALAQAAGGALSQTTANLIANAAVNAMTGQDMNPADALSFAFNTILPGSGEVVDPNVIDIAIESVVDVLVNPDNYIENPDGTVDMEDVWGEIDYEGIEGEFDPDDPNNAYDPDLIDPQLPKLPTDDEGGGGEAPAEDADNDGTPAAQDPDDSDPNVPVSGGIVNETGEEVSIGGEKVEDDGDGTQAGLEYRWKYLGDGCFVQIDENGNEIPDTKVCDPNYTEEDYEFYEVGGIFGRGTDEPFGTPKGDEEDVTPAYEPPAAGTDLGYECLPNGDKVVYTADGEGGTTVEVVSGGCLNKEGILDPSILSGTISAGDDSVDSTGGVSDAGGDADTGVEGKEDGEDIGDGIKDGVGDREGDGDESGDGISLPSFGAGGKGQFTPFRAGLSYQPVQPVSLIETPQKDYVAELNGELDKFFSRNMKKSMFEGMI